MARGVNKAIVIGNLGNNPEVRYTPSGTCIASLSVATNEVWKDRNGEQQERVEWHRVTLFDRLAEIAGEYLQKGSQVYIEGRIQTDKWQDKDGNDRYTTKIIVREMQMLANTKPADSASSAAADTYEQASGGRAEPRNRKEAARQVRRDAAGTPPPADDFDDDIPY